MASQQCLLIMGISTIVHLLLIPKTAGSNCTFSPSSAYSGIQADCRHQNRTEVPRSFPKDTTVITLSNNKLTTVKNYSFNYLVTLKRLDLNNNLITHLEAMAFYGCTSLQHLDLSSNKLNLTVSSYPEQIFYSLKNLEWLSMKHNHPGIRGHYPDTIFEDLKNLLVLRIDTFAEPHFGRIMGNLHKLQELVLGGLDCQMDTLTNKTFHPFVNTNIEVLDISGCPLRTFEIGAFAPLTNLQELLMRNVPVGIKKALKSLSSFVGRVMRKIDLCDVRDSSRRFGIQMIKDSTVEYEDVQYLAKICLSEFNIAQNELLYCSFIAILNSNFSKCATRIYASENRFYPDPPELLPVYQTFSKIEYVDVSLQEQGHTRTSRPVVSRRGFQGYINNTTFQLLTGNLTTPIQRQDVGTTGLVTVYFPKTLRYANFSAFISNYGNADQNIRIINAESLTYINISFNGIAALNISVEGLDSLLSFDISGNPQLTLSDYFFDTFPSIERLHLSFSSFQQDALLRQGRRLFKPLTKLKRLFLSSNFLSDLPKDLFQTNPNLSHIDLSRNLFDSIPLDLQLLQKLSVLDLTFNSIRVLDKVSQVQIDRHASDWRFQLLLNGNPFACGCESLEFLFWMKHTMVVLDNNRNYSCLLENGKISNTAKVMGDFDQLWRKCTGVSLFYVSSILMVLIIASILGMLWIKTNKTALVNRVLKLLRQEVPKPERCNFSKDVYVSYADADYQWICHYLRPALEVRNVSTFIWDRDSIPGDSIPDQITENMALCWKVLIYFTGSYERDPWTYMSMMAAINSVGNCSPYRIILFLPEEEHPCLPQCLLDVVPESCIFQVPSDEDEDDKFWDMVKSEIQNS